MIWKKQLKAMLVNKKYNCNDNPLMLAVYQYVAEGRAARNWQMMADIIEDNFISDRYGKIAKDEGFHATIGEMELAKLCDDQAAQDEINAMINDFRKDLFQVTCAKSGMLPETQKIMEDAYGA